jgi:serine/threonine protein phosphatase PrpC
MRRENNEDRYYCDAGRGLFMVIDGVGGHAAGEKAAEAALRMLRTRLERETGAPEDRLREAITLANNEVFRLAQSEPEWNGMACVLTSALVRDGRLVVGHVGDTRLYAFRDGRVRKVTHDHSPVGEREDRGELDEADAMRHPRRNEIYRDVGSEPHNPTDEHFVEILNLPFEDDSAILLCSDGLSDLVDSKTVAEIVYEHAAAPEQVVRQLIQAANDAGGKDNVTAVFAAGPRFADAVRRIAGTALQPSPPVDGWQTATGGPQNRSRRRRVSIPWWVAVAAALAIGCALGLALAFLALTRVDGVSEWVLEANRPETWARTWTVGFDTGAEFTTIEDALVQAQPGDTIRVGPGEYRTPLVMRPGIAVVSVKPHEAILRPAAGARPLAVVLFPPGAHGNDAAAKLAGFRISGDVEHPVDFGILVEAAGEVDDVEVSGAARAAVVLQSGSRAVVRGSYIHDNAGIGIVVRAGAAPRLQHNVITANGKSGARPLPGIEIQEGANPHLFGNIVLGNGDDQVVGLPAAGRADVVRDNIVGQPPTLPKAPAIRRP